MKRVIFFLSAFFIYASVQAGGPKITVKGGTAITVDVGDPNYKDPGATAIDSAGADISGSIVKDDSVNINKIGSYTIKYKVTDAYGKADSALRTVNVVDRIPPGIICAQRIYQKGSAFDPFEGFSTVDNYYPPNSFFNGIDGCKIEVDSSHLNLKAPGNYEICYKVTDGSGNTTSRCCMVIVTEALSVNRLPAGAIFGLYPNPSEGNVTVSLKNADAQQIQVSDALGKTVLTQAIPPGERSTALDLTNCADGMYFITVSTATGIYSQKISIKK